MTHSYILTRLDGIEQELAEIRRHLQAEERKFRKVRSLYGLMRGAEFSKEDIDQVTRSILTDSYDD